MGNRVYVVFEDENSTEFSPAVYLHWNGGAESIYAFLDAMDRYEVRGSDDMSYQVARFVQIVANFFGGTLSLGVYSAPADEKEMEKYVEENGLFVVYRGPTTRRIRRLSYDNKWLTKAQVDAEEKKAYAHEYHKPKKGETIDTQIDEANLSHFKKNSER